MSLPLVAVAHQAPVRTASPPTAVLDAMSAARRRGISFVGRLRA
jgi:hypothetical protein